MQTANMTTASPQYSLSVVSHGQGHLIKNLLADLRSLNGGSFEILLTLNIAEDKGFLAEFSDLPLTLIENTEPKGFGANHNAAFQQSRGAVFVIVNPDIRSPQLNLTQIGQILEDAKIGACAPKILASNGRIEDSARRFPSFGRLAVRVLLRRKEADYDLSGAVSKVVSVDWVAGMWVAYPRAAFAAVGGFDERYFMYMEDADICRRLRRHGYDIVLDTSTSVVHDAQRASGRNRQHLKWHTRSAIRFLTGL
jgi:N-acetylglucosaminyl-diphospho-decaprenol L-rhamnosyltransferase